MTGPNRPALVVVGQGFFGLTVGETVARTTGRRVLVLERRSSGSPGTATWPGASRVCGSGRPTTAP